MIRMANDDRLNTPPASGISRPAVISGNATSTTANPRQAKHSRRYRLHAGAHRIALTTPIASSAPFCVVNNTAPTVTPSSRKRRMKCLMRGAMIRAKVGSSIAAEIELRAKPAARLSKPLSISQPRETSTWMPPTWVSSPIHGNV